MSNEVKASEFEWDQMRSMVHVVRAQMSTQQFNELKGLAALSGKTLQQFVGDALCAVIRKHKQKGD
jgi:hypothetical protein|tara:strand:+ start:678 stop:875 length:198 start_codon:yes stop_codon:yes gene_type:complete